MGSGEHNRRHDLRAEKHRSADGDVAHGQRLPRAIRVRASKRQVCNQGITHICIAVSDIAAEHARLSAAGMAFLSPPQDVPGLCRAVYGRDPDGNIVELIEADPAGPFALPALT